MDGYKEYYISGKIQELIAAMRSALKPGTIPSTKIDGCLHKDTLIKTSVGDVPFGKICEDWPRIKYTAYGFDENSGEVKPVVLTLPHFIENAESYYEIELEDGTIVKATGNHPFKVKNKGYVKVEELKEGDDLQDCTPLKAK